MKSTTSLVAPAPRRMISRHAHMSLTRLGERPPTGSSPRDKLRKYMLDHELTVNEFSMMCCFNRKVLDVLFNGGAYHPKGGYLQLHQAFAIEYNTQGAVKAYEWLDDPYFIKRIRDSRMSRVKDFEVTSRRYVTKWASLTDTDGVIRERARSLSRLFGVQWGEVKARAWIEARRAAKLEIADVHHLYEPEFPPINTDGTYDPGQDDKERAKLTHEEWFTEVRKQGLY